MIRFCGYILGIALALCGVLGLVSEILDQKSNFIFFGYVLGSLFLIGGVLLIWALLSRYGGGLWSAAGYILVALGASYGSSMLDDFLKQERPSSTDSLICAVLWLLGVSFLVHGHKRHSLTKANGLSPGYLPLGSAGAPQPRSLLRSLPFVPAWLGFAFGAWFVWHYFSTGLELHAFAETCRHDGLSLDLEELNRLYAAIPSQQNAAIVYEEAFTNLVSADTVLIERLATNLVEQIGILDPRKLAEVEVVIARNRKALDLLHAGAVYPQCRYSLQLRDRSVPEFPHLDGLWTSAQLLALENLDSAAKGRNDKAVDSIIALLGLGDSLAKEPFFGSQHSREFCNATASAEIEKILSSCALQESELRRLADALRKTEQTTDYSGAYLDNLNQAMRADSSKCIDASYPRRPLWAALCKAIVLITDRESADKLYYGNSLRSCLRALKNPYPLRLQMMPKSSDEQAYAKRHGYFISAYFLKWRRVLSMAETENSARIRVVQAAVAIERYRGAGGGEPPENLKQIVPRFLPAKAEDPLDGYPLRYRRLKPGYVVYSIGKDMKDDGGRARQPGQKWNDSYDIVTRVGR